jgi:hypothetical protein
LVGWSIGRRCEKSKDLGPFWGFWDFFAIQRIGDSATWIGILHESIESYKTRECLYGSYILLFFWSIESYDLSRMDETIFPIALCVYLYAEFICEITEFLFCK